MMRLTRVGVPVAMLLLSACSTSEWVHPNKPKEEYAHDYNRCDTETMQNPRLQGGTKLVVQQAIERCLAKKGWVLREKRD